jgi:hypothetical protein
MLMWHRRLWLIDHGAALYFHHTSGWESGPDRSRTPFAAIAKHVLWHRATRLREIDAAMAEALTPAVMTSIVEAIPEAWLEAGDPAVTPAHTRAAYVRYLVDRLAAPRTFVEETAGDR